MSYRHVRPQGVFGDGGRSVGRPGCEGLSEMRGAQGQGWRGERSTGVTGEGAWGGRAGRCDRAE